MAVRRIWRPIAGTNVAATVTSDAFQTGEGITGLIMLVKSTGTITGTSPTLNVRMQHGMVLASGTIAWVDYLSATQHTGTAAETWVRVQAAGEEMHAASAAALAAGEMRNGPIPGLLRVLATIGGTNPVYPGIEVIVELIP